MWLDGYFFYSNLCLGGVNELQRLDRYKLHHLPVCVWQTGSEADNERKWAF